MNTSDDMDERMACVLEKAYKAGDDGLLLVTSLRAESEDSYAIELLVQAEMMYQVSEQMFRLTRHGNRLPRQPKTNRT